MKGHLHRARVSRAYVNDGLVLLDVQLATGEQRTRVELLLPAGITIIPRVGADVLVAGIGGDIRDLVALQADDGAARVFDASAGDLALRAHGVTVLITADRISITGAPEVLVDAPTIKLGTGATKAVKLADGSNATKVFAE